VSFPRLSMKLPPLGSTQRLDLENRFWAKIKRTNPDSCWEWLGCLKGSGKGYGSIHFNGRMVRAHRVALAIKLGRSLLPSEHALHYCDNTRCCNPAHLYPGDHAQNMRDTATRNRRIGLRGSDNAKAKLNDEAVKHIRASTATLRYLAAKYGVSESLISLVRRRKIWTHLTD
jgi:hypothetical protein